MGEAFDFHPSSRESIKFHKVVNVTIPTGIGDAIQMEFSHLGPTDPGTPCSAVFEGCLVPPSPIPSQPYGIQKSYLFGIQEPILETLEHTRVSHYITMGTKMHLYSQTRSTSRHVITWLCCPQAQSGLAYLKASSLSNIRGQC